MKTDMQLQRDVAEELRWEPRINAEDVGIAVHDGVVTLTGTVGSWAQRRAAAKAAERVAGVRAVAQELEVKLLTAFRRTDTELAHQVVKALDWDIEVPSDRIQAKVEKGWVTLEGTVDWQYQRKAAERAVRYLTGVQGVTNLMQLAKQPSPYDVAEQIKKALHRSAEMDAKQIEVKASEGRVILTGTVRSWPERADAERAAWNASGVVAVEDRLAVVP